MRRSRAAWLHAAGIRTHRCHDVAEVCAAMDTAAAALLADEALPALALDVLRPALQRQPVWSDFPLILLTSSARATAALWQRVQALGAVGNVTVLERPLTPVTLLSTVQVALRSRRRQHELRQLHAAQHRHIAAQAAPWPSCTRGTRRCTTSTRRWSSRSLARTAALQHEMAERQRLEREAQRVQHFALLGRLAAGVSHEIRNPLGAVFLHVDLLSEELQQPSPDSPAVVAEALAEIKTQPRARGGPGAGLSLAGAGGRDRADAGGSGPGGAGVGDRVPGPGRPAGRLAPAGGPRRAGAGGVSCGRPCAARSSTWCRTRCEAMPQGGTLTLTGRSTPTHVQLQIRDTGSGIASAQLATIFEPLYTTKPGGTGLGLYIVQEIVAAHGGQVTVESAEGQGTTFTLTLPRGLSEAGEGQ